MSGNFKRNLQLLFQPYGWCEPYPQFLGQPSDKPLAMFAELYHETIGGKINLDGVKNLEFIILRELGIDVGIRIFSLKGKGNKYEDIVLPDKFKKCQDGNFVSLIYILNETRETGIFDYLECDFEEFKSSINLKNTNDDIFQTVRYLGRILICDIVNDYITSTSLSINENGDFVMEIGDKFLMNIIFDELAVLCQFYETRKCKFRKYQIREGRRSKRERSC